MDGKVFAIGQNRKQTAREKLGCLLLRMVEEGKTELYGMASLKTLLKTHYRNIQNNLGWFLRKSEGKEMILDITGYEEIINQGKKFGEVFVSLGKKERRLFYLAFLGSKRYYDRKL